MTSPNVFAGAPQSPPVSGVGVASHQRPVPRPGPPSPSSSSSSSSVRSAWRAVTSRKHRKIVLFCLLAGLLLITFGVYATTQGPPPKVEAVVYFSPSATAEQKDAVRAACPTVGNAIQLPPDTSGLATSRVYPLRYDIATASTADRATLFMCVQAQPGVIGISEFTQGQ